MKKPKQKTKTNSADEFLFLKEKWYKKLKNSGFEDIEQDEKNLKVWESFFFDANYLPIEFEAKEIYFQKAGQFIYDHEFRNKYEKLVWEMHANGETNKNIVKVLKRRRIVKVNNLKVTEVSIGILIKKLAKIMLTGKDA